jgi:hypothetical protein
VSAIDDASNSDASSFQGSAASPVSHGPSVAVSSMIPSTVLSSVDMSYTYAFSQQDFAKAVKKLSSAFANLDSKLSIPQLNIPDGYLSCTFVRRQISEQLRVKLSQAEIQALCYKLWSTGTEGCLQSDRHFVDETKVLFVGKVLKSLIVRIGSYSTKKLAPLPSLRPQSRSSSPNSQQNSLASNNRPFL